MESTTLVCDTDQESDASPFPRERERALSADSLFQGKDEVGREGWFLRIEVTGLYARRCGPFKSQEEACEFLDAFLNNHVMEGLVDILNEMDRPDQNCVVEGVQRLTATASEQ